MVDVSEWEHCFQTTTDFMRLFDSLAEHLSDEDYEAVESQFSLLLLRERAAADKAGYERGLAEGFNQGHMAGVGALLPSDTATIRQYLSEVQSKYETLATAARAVCALVEQYGISIKLSETNEYGILFALVVPEAADGEEGME